MFIDNEWRDSSTRFDDIDPASGRVIARLPQASKVRPDAHNKMAAPAS